MLNINLIKNILYSVMVILIDPKLRCHNKSIGIHYKFNYYTKVSFKIILYVIYIYILT